MNALDAPSSMIQAQRGVGILWRSLEYIRIGALYDGKYDGIPNFVLYYL
jgi:hypothetical protein